MRDSGDYRVPPDGELDQLDRLLEGLALRSAERLRRRQQLRRWGRGGLSLLGAAAAVAGLWLVTREQSPPALAPEPTAGLDVSSSRSFVVMPTSRDDVTVIWLLEPETP